MAHGRGRFSTESGRRAATSRGCVSRCRAPKQGDDEIVFGGDGMVVDASDVLDRYPKTSSASCFWRCPRREFAQVSTKVTAEVMLLVMGLCTLVLFITHGAIYLALKTTQEVRERARSIAVSVGPVTVIIMALAVGWQQIIRGTLGSIILGIGAVVALGVACVLTRIGRDGWAFTASAVSTALVVGWFASLYPDVLPSTLDPAFSLNIENAASTPYTLTLMSWVALLFVPLIIAYQAWSYWVFRKRVSVNHIPESPTSVEIH